MTAPLPADIVKQARKKSSLQALHEANRESLSPRREDSPSNPKRPPGISTGRKKGPNLCHCAQVINNGLNLMINTPLIIRWALNERVSSCSVQKIMWSFKSSFVLAVDIAMDKTSFRRDEVIEFELTVKNNTFEELDLALIMIDECIENNYKRVYFL